MKKQISYTNANQSKNNKFIKTLWLCSLLVIGLLLVSCSTGELVSSRVSASDRFIASVDKSWGDAFDNIVAPTIIFDNKKALDARLYMLQQAPSGSDVLILAFVFENGKTTRELAVNVCHAARRGVNVKWLMDSKSGSVPGKADAFDHPINEEIYQYMANCGAEVRIHNYIKEKSKLGALWSSFVDRFTGKESVFLSEINRLNHRKLFLVKTPANEVCFLLGGRNLGDHYLAWEGDGDSFVDSDIIICNHLKNSPDNLPLANQNNFKKLAQDAQSSFNLLWNDDVNGGKDLGVPVKVYKYEGKPHSTKNFTFEYLYDEHIEDPSEIGQKLNTKKRVMNENHSNINEEDQGLSGIMPEYREVKKPPFGSSTKFRLSYDWELKKSIWNPKYDEVRQSLHEMVKKEQAEIYIESAYMEYDNELKTLLEEALARGVRVIVVTNSVFIADGPSKAISLVRANFQNKLLGQYGDNLSSEFPDFANWQSNRHFYSDPEQKGRFLTYVSTYYAGHMIHFKGAGFKCQKQNQKDGTITYNKSFILGSHNFHERSGLSDKEHALIWKEPVDLVCAHRILGGSLEAKEESGFTLEQIKEIESRYTETSNLKPRFNDLIEHRLRFWSRLNAPYKKQNTPLLLGFASLAAELEQKKESYNKGIKGRFKGFVSRLLYVQNKNEDGDSFMSYEKVPELTPAGKLLIRYLSPITDWAKKAL